MLKGRFNIKQKFLDFIDNTAWIAAILRFLHIRDAREDKREFRTIYINNVKPGDYRGSDEPLKYKSNEIITSKYTWWNFIFKNLFEQFRRVANFYFLLNLIIIFIIPDPPTNPYTSMIPLLFVIIVTAIKQGYEDILRHKSDREINNIPVRILRDGEFKNYKWHDIVCGDIVEVLADQPFPCDLILLYSNTENQGCHITTANLDGETNLKVRSIPPRIPVCSTVQELSNLRGVIQCDKPNLRLYEFKGKMIIDNKEYSMTNDNVLLRGSCLRVSPLVYGCAIYTGLDTKMMKNSQFKSNKLSCIERKLNQFIIVFLIILAIITFASFIASFAYVNIYKTHWYLLGTEPSYYSNTSLYNFIVLVFYMNLYNYIVPLSMYVTIELQRFVGSQFIEWDLEMYDQKTDQPAKANTSDLNEDLGQVQYLFSDKTGTLTENEMEFQQFSIDGIIYKAQNGQIVDLHGEIYNLSEDPTMFRFFEMLSLCHTVQVDESAKEKYQASSPDEFAFIKFCLKLGIEYIGEQKEPGSHHMIRQIKIGNQIRKYKVLHILEFDSTRKRMSIILQDLQTSQLMLFCKGAETAIFKNCVKGNVQGCNADIKRFAEEGWRTLAFSFRNLSKQEYQKIEQMLDDAYNDIVNRDQKMIEANDAIESNLELVGASAVEDKLQEEVADTLESLRKAGIKIWVLTGDKKETAVNISHTCKHFSEVMLKLFITDLVSVEEIKKKLEQFDREIATHKNESFALVIDGGTLGHLFGAGEALKKDFCDICLKCDAVLCCRMTPAQKAEVVKLVKNTRAKPMTAAIGDGANDVSMIQEAHVGLGIFGKEGRNAARSADFAFAKFKYARRIILVHGYLYYTRAAYLVQYFFYKNLAFVICQFYYAFSNAFSVSTLFDTIVLTLYNVVFTAAPILLFGLFEQKVSIKKIQKEAYLYRSIKENKLLRVSEFAKWNALALWHSVVCYFSSYALFSTATPFYSDGKLIGSFEFGALVIMLIITVVHAKLLLEWSYMTPWLLFGYFLSFLAFIVFLIIPNSFIMPSFLTSLTDNQSLYWIYFEVLAKPTTWFLILLAIFACILPDIVLKVVENVQYNLFIKRLKKEDRERTAKHRRELERVRSVSLAPTPVRVFRVSPTTGNRPASTKVYKETMDIPYSNSPRLNTNEGKMLNDKIYNHNLTDRRKPSKELNASNISGSSYGNSVNSFGNMDMSESSMDRTHRTSYVNPAFTTEL